MSEQRLLYSKNFRDTEEALRKQKALAKDLRVPWNTLTRAALAYALESLEVQARAVELETKRKGKKQK